MARELRIEYPGAIYHVMSRGDHREAIFRGKRDRAEFLCALEEACEKTGWQIHAWCLMGNHFHLVIETPRANLVAGMKWLLGVYTKRFNIRHKLCGHLFAGRYKALLVEGGGGGYLRTVCDYVHLNPARAKLVKAGAPLESFGWSSYGEYLKPPKERRPWVRVDRLFGEKGIPRDSEAGRREFARQMEARRGREDAGGEYEESRRGWCVGSEAFRNELLGAALGRAGASHSGPAQKEVDVEKAERLVAAGLAGLGWGESDLERRRKGDKEKVGLARRLRKETTMTPAWIARRLRMGAWTYVAKLIYAEEKKECKR